MIALLVYYFKVTFNSDASLSVYRLVILKPTFAFQMIYQLLTPSEVWHLIDLNQQLREFSFNLKDVNKQRGSIGIVFDVCLCGRGDIYSILLKEKLSKNCSRVFLSFSIEHQIFNSNTVPHIFLGQKVETSKIGRISGISIQFFN